MLLFILVSIILHNLVQNAPINLVYWSEIMDVGTPKWTHTCWKKIWVVFSVVIYLLHGINKPMHYYIQLVMTPFWHRKPHYKIHGDTLPRMRRNMEWWVQPQFSISGITSRAHHTPIYILGYNFFHPSPITKPLQMIHLISYPKFPYIREVWASRITWTLSLLGIQSLPKWQSSFPCKW